MNELTDWLFPVLGLFEGAVYDFWDWMTGRTHEIGWWWFFGAFRRVWVPRRWGREQFFPRGFPKP